MQTMQPILATELERSKNFLYEIKYDGFRAVLYWNPSYISLKSRNDTDLSFQFPEIIQACQELSPLVKHVLPLQLDGELVILNNAYEANFSLLQKRGRMRSRARIVETAKRRPASFVVFDLLISEGTEIRKKQLWKRKQRLEKLFANLPTKRLSCVPVFPTYDAAKKVTDTYMAEGIVAKRKQAEYSSGKHHRDWWKEKNWRTIYAFITAYQPDNGYIELGVFEGERVTTIGRCKHGLSKNEQEALLQMFQNEGRNTLPPAICASVHTLGQQEGELREPSFVQLLPQMEASTCTTEKLKRDLAMLPTSIDFSNEMKAYWNQAAIQKGDLLIYMRYMYPYIHPYVENRALTLIRCPEGVEGACFFQKHLPTYSPKFMHCHDEAIVGNRLEHLLWLANHGAVEYHIPFNHIEETRPESIIFDLDPPSTSAFPMAVETALLFQRVLEELELTTFIKTSGGKGLQIHLPIPHGAYTYQETANFTAHMASIIVEAAPELCTTERLKKKRKGKLYIDHVQHGKKKTIIAPYSPRTTTTATVATPLFWEEVNSTLSPDLFTMKTVPNRIKERGCPWLFQYEKARGQSFAKAEPLFWK